MMVRVLVAMVIAFVTIGLVGKEQMSANMPHDGHNVKDALEKTRTDGLRIEWGA